MKFEKFLFNCAIIGNSIAKYAAGEKVILVHERNYEEKGRIIFESVESYESAIESALIDENDATYNQTRALAAVLDKFFNTNMIA